MAYRNYGQGRVWFVESQWSSLKTASAVIDRKIISSMLVAGRNLNSTIAIESLADSFVSALQPSDLALSESSELHVGSNEAAFLKLPLCDLSFGDPMQSVKLTLYKIGGSVDSDLVVE